MLGHLHRHLLQDRRWCRISRNRLKRWLNMLILGVKGGRCGRVRRPWPNRQLRFCWLLDVRVKHPHLGQFLRLLTASWWPEHALLDVCFELALFASRQILQVKRELLLARVQLLALLHDRHDALLLVLSQLADELGQLRPLLFAHGCLALRVLHVCLDVAQRHQAVTAWLFRLRLHHWLELLLTCVRLDLVALWCFMDFLMLPGSCSLCMRLHRFESRFFLRR